MYAVEILLGLESNKPVEEFLIDAQKIFPGILLSDDGSEIIVPNNIETIIIDTQKTVLEEFLSKKSTQTKNNKFGINRFSIDNIEYHKSNLIFMDNDGDEDCNPYKYIGIELTSAYQPVLLDYGIECSGSAPPLTKERMRLLNMFKDEVISSLPNIKDAYLCFPLVHY